MEMDGVSVMTRPALIIGLGGTGQWVLTYLKKDLLETGIGKMPSVVRLLCFDTEKHPSNTFRYEDSKLRDRNDERYKKVGSIILGYYTEYDNI
jgi:hypothetical protein